MLLAPKGGSSTWPENRENNNPQSLMSNLLICIDRKDFPAQIPHPYYLPETSPVVLCGSTNVLSLPRVALLNSRQSPRLSRTQSWIQKTLEALHRFDPRETALVTSLGTPAWDFLTWAGGKLGFPLIIVFPAGSAQSFNVVRTRTIIDFGLDDRRVLAVRPVRLGKKRPSAEDSLLRDRWVTALSHQLIPVSLRPKGNLDGLLSHPALPTTSVTSDFRIKSKPPAPIRKPLLLGQIHMPDWYAPEEYLIHWTRSCVGPYPNESRGEYFTRIMEGDTEPTEGMETLERILQDGVIRASSRLVRGGYSVVPFTERPPQDLPRLMLWRSGLRRWTFEPYGIALSKAKLLELGARPVIYGEVAHFHELTQSDRPFFQVAKSAGSDWTVEREWRVTADVRLSEFAKDEIVVVVRDAAEMEKSKEKLTLKVICLTD
jgi:hypothetical protein